MSTPMMPAKPAARYAGASASGAKEFRWGEGKSDPVARRAAVKLGMRPQAVEKLINGPDSCFDRCGALVESFVEEGDLVRLTRKLERIDAARSRITAQPFDAALVKRVAEADCADDVARELLLEAKTREAAITAIRKSQATRAALLQFELAAAKQWQIWL